MGHPPEKCKTWVQFKLLLDIFICINPLGTFLRKFLHMLSSISFPSLLVLQDLKEHARFSFSESNIFTSRRPNSRVLGEALRPTKSETSTGLQDIAECWRRNVCINCDHISHNDKLSKPESPPSGENVLTVKTLSHVFSEKMPKIMMNRSTQILKGDLKNQSSSKLKALNFKIDFYQLVLTFLLEAKEMLLETNQLLKRLCNNSEISSINDDYSNDGDKSTSNSTSTCSLNK
ncbi:hypothetical protein J437_LFUL018876 [Ladona fulva]|uniref:Uncharacterized protein n=1 Tax=Ladona fulva TaxID=123851 RepID=A0A8K0KPA0_LADFU|nr:hypothetical protein J437_LFUL018876 [Ladona fulva]